MKLKAIFESALAGVVAAIFSYSALISPATHAAIDMRRRMPDAWFSSSIVWYATAVVLGISLVVAGSCIGWFIDRWQGQDHENALSCSATRYGRKQLGPGLVDQRSDVAL
jgi:hypothetical protein